jgi:hypothetical protein
MATPQPNIIATIKAMPQRTGEQVRTIGVSQSAGITRRKKVFFIEIFWLKGGERQEKIGTPALPEGILLCGEPLHLSCGQNDAAHGARIFRGLCRSQVALYVRFISERRTSINASTSLSSTIRRLPAASQQLFPHVTVIYSRTPCSARKANVVPATTLTSIMRMIASNDPSP